MDRLILLILALAIVACSPTPDECIAGPPGDEHALAWVAPDSAEPCPPPRPEVDCQGGTLRDLQVRESCTIVRGCVLRGDTRVAGPYGSANQADPQLTRRADWVSRVRAAAPHHVRFEGCDFRGRLYVTPGSTFVSAVDCDFRSLLGKSLVYLDAESHGARFKGCRFDGRLSTGPMISVDASDGVEITDSSFRGRGALLGAVAIAAYRNSGETGRTRQTTPQGRASGNTFSGVDVAYHLSSRDGNRGYCPLDAGAEIGSSGSDLDHAHDWTIEGLGKVKLGVSAERIRVRGRWIRR